MDPIEFQKLYRIERDHWFYKGKRTIVKRWIKNLTRLSQDSICLDIGAGTGLFAKEMSQECRSYGIEPSWEAINIVRQNGIHQNIVAGSALEIPFADQTADIITSLDVIEHIVDHQKALKEMARVTKDGGFMIITVPAFSFLMSDWDESLGHVRRYHISDFKELLAGLPVQVIIQKYINVLLFLPIAAYRYIRKISKGKAVGRLEDMIPPKFLNRFFLYSFVHPALANWFNPPFGLSILLILRKLPVGQKDPQTASLLQDTLAG